MAQKVNTSRRVFYVALGAQTGLTDVILEVRRPNGNVFGSYPMNEAGDGLYYADYIPSELGMFQEKVISISNGDKTFSTVEVVSANASDLATDLNDVKGDVDNIASQISVINAKVDAIGNKIFASGYFA